MGVGYGVEDIHMGVLFRAFTMFCKVLIGKAIEWHTMTMNTTGYQQFSETIAK